MDDTPSRSLRFLLQTFEEVLQTAAHRCGEDLPGLSETLQELVITIGTGDRGALGWFDQEAWVHSARVIPEIVINADYLDRDPEDLLTTGLHEAAHAFAAANEIQDTSRGGRYHNRRFAEIAEKIGLEVRADLSIGCITPGLSEVGRCRYADLLPELHRALGLVRVRDLHLTPRGAGHGSNSTTIKGPRPSEKYVFVGCACRTARGRPYIGRYAQGSWRPDVLVCQACGQPLAPIPKP